jgi:anti-sigma factor RsiW
MSHCTGCRTRSEQAAELRQALRSPELYYTAPRRLANFRVAPSQPRWGSPFRLHASYAAAALALVAVFGMLLIRRAPDQGIAQQVIAGHIRSLMAAHLTDVPSSDQHTVKPWFNGRLDYAPAVRDLAASGYPLVGGRLDYIAGRPVAALVYAHRLHRINVFLWPAHAADSGLHALAMNGYNVVNWNRAGMTYWAVSDLNSHDLTTFAGQLK